MFNGTLKLPDIARHTFIRATNIAEFITANPVGQKLTGVLYTFILITLLVVVVVYGARRIGTTPGKYVSKNTDDLCLPA